MYHEGDIVTLAGSKEHFDGVDTLKLSKGACGMIVGGRQNRTGLEYVVDFGPYGRWNCLPTELDGNDPEGWDQPVGQESVTLLNIADVLGIRTEGRVIHSGTGVPEQPVWTFDREETESHPVVDVEADIARRVKELEREIQ